MDKKNGEYIYQFPSIIIHIHFNPLKICSHAQPITCTTYWPKRAKNILSIINIIIGFFLDLNIIEFFLDPNPTNEYT